MLRAPAGTRSLCGPRRAPLLGKPALNSEAQNCGRSSETHPRLARSSLLRLKKTFRKPVCPDV